jgi:Initiator Replication protein
MAKKKKKILLSSAIITQANELVSARYTLPLAEQRLVLTMISRIQPDDEDFKPYRISVGEMAEFIGVAKGSAYRECRKITKSLLTRVLEIHEPGRLLQVNWVSSAEYIDGSGMVNLSFDPLLKPYLLQLKGNFTSCKLEMMLGFKSQYTVRMYSLLKQYERLKKREMEMSELRDTLGLTKSQYQRYNDFKKDILEATQKELKEKSDLSFEFDEIKFGRRVGAIRFHIVITKKLLDAAVIEPEIEDTPALSILDFSLSEFHSDTALDQLRALVLEPHRTKKTVIAALVSFEKKHGFDYVKRNILYSNTKADKSYAGFLNNALKNDWGHDWELDQKIQPVRKKVVEIWVRQGFSNQKEYDETMYRKQMEQYGKAGFIK